MIRTRILTIVALAILTFSPAIGLASQATPVGSPEASPEASPVASQLPVEQIVALTGPGDASLNDTGGEYSVYGTDLGSSFMFGDEMYLIFGDTFGIDKIDWRSNVAAVTTDRDPSDGLTFDRMITDREGHAGELLPAKRLDFDEITVIPTYGVAVGKRMFLHYMSVSHWGPPGQWELGLSGWAYSDAAGQTWTKDAKATWPGDSNFGQVAIEEHDGYLYIFGIPGGRFGGVHLARVQPEKLLDIPAYEYWTGSGWEAGAAERAATIVPAPVGELSVRWNSYYHTWIMMYLNEDKYSIVLRTADDLTGPWGEEQVVATGAEFPALYAPFQFPLFNDGPDIYFAMSMFGPYEVYMMRTRLE